MAHTETFFCSVLQRPCLPRVGCCIQVRAYKKVVLSPDPPSTLQEEKGLGTRLATKMMAQILYLSSGHFYVPSWNSVVNITRGVLSFPSLDQGMVRGHTDSATSPQSLLGHVYSLIRSNKQHRRAFLRALLRHFENYEVKQMKHTFREDVYLCT